MDTVFVIFYLSQDYWVTRHFCGVCTEKGKIFDIVKDAYIAWGYDINDEDRFLRFYYEDIEIREVPLNTYYN